MKEKVDISYTLIGSYPWVITLHKNGQSIKIEETLTIKQLEDRHNLQDGDTITELRPFSELIFTRKNGVWYRENTGMGYV